LSEQAPSVPEGYFRLLDQLLKLHDEISGNVEVQQGRVPFSGASGKLIENLITQATGPLAMRSRFTEFAWERIAREAMHCIVKFMDTDAIAKIVSNLPRHVLEIVLK